MIENNTSSSAVSLREESSAFVLFNEQESAAYDVVSLLESWGIRTLRGNPLQGDAPQDTALQGLVAARVVLVILGPQGWGLMQERLTQQAQQFGKRVIPVSLDSVRPEDTRRCGGLFQRLRNFSLPLPPTAESLKSLADHIRSAPATSEPTFGGMIDKLIDGTEGERFRVLWEIESLPAIHKAGLALKVREELGTRFDPERSRTFGSAARPVNLIPGIRSWLFSALIACDTDSPESKQLLLAELTDDASIKFWILAQLYVTQSKFVGDAAAIIAGTSFAQADVRLLANSILKPVDINWLEAELKSGQFERQWPVLRTQRVLRLPGLVETICGLFLQSDPAEPLAYDALFALSNTAEASVRALESLVGVRGAVRSAVKVAAVSNEMARLQFAGLLAAFQNDLVEEVFRELEQSQDVSNLVRQLRLGIREYRRRQGVLLPGNPGYLSDEIKVDLDFLEFRRDVRTLTSVLTAKNVRPPLAVGLFGAWGSGKSHFMRSMEQDVKLAELQANASDSATTCRNVVQIWFNAWHYVDSNLWASLVSHIFEKLSEYLSPETDTAEEERKLLQELKSRRNLEQEIKRKQERLKRTIEDRRQRLAEKRVERENREIRLRDLNSADAGKLLSGSADFRERIQRVLKSIAADTLMASLKNLSSELHEAKSVVQRMVVICKSLQASKWSWFLFWGILVLIGVPLLIDLILPQVEDALRTLMKEVVRLSVVLGGGFGIFSDLLKSLHSGLQKLDEAKSIADDVLKQKREAETPEEQQLKREIAELSVEEAQLQQEFTSTVAQLAETEQRLAAIENSSSLAAFLDDRMRLEDYRRHLGIKSQIRRDFEDLQRLFRNGQWTGGGEKRNVERVILYIDDLDRCSQETVIEVLEAVHLLLAFDLFVVVVGVDPRWLLHSLKRKFSAFRIRGEEQTTPQKYLEKIFQIPYSLPEMTATGFGSMVSYELSGNSASNETPRSAGTVLTASGGAVKNDAPRQPADIVAAGNNLSGERVVSELLQENSENSVTERQENGQRAPFNPSHETRFANPELLEIRPWEQRFAERLHAIIRTPRAIRRFANVYRFVKASVDPVGLTQYEGTESSPGEFQVPMLLLGMLIGEPDECERLFPQMLRAASDGEDMASFIRDESRLSSERLRTILLAQIEAAPLHWSADTVERWIRVVAKFSFKSDVAEKAGTVIRKTGAN